MSQTFTEDTVVETLDDTIVVRGGGPIDPQVSPAPDARGVGFPSPGHVVGLDVSQISDPHANSTVIMGGGGARAITPPNPDIVFDIPSIPTVTGQGSTDPSGSRPDVSTLGADVSPVADKLGNLSITGGSQQGESAPPNMTDVIEVEVERVDIVESDDDNEERVKIKSCGLAPFD